MVYWSPKVQRSDIKCPETFFRHTKYCSIAGCMLCRICPSSCCPMRYASQSTECCSFLRCSVANLENLKLSTLLFFWNSLVACTFSSNGGLVLGACQNNVNYQVRERTISAFRKKLKLIDNICQCCFGNNLTLQLFEESICSICLNYNLSWESQYFDFFFLDLAFIWIGWTLFESCHYSKFTSRISFDKPNFRKMSCRIVERYVVDSMKYGWVWTWWIFFWKISLTILNCFLRDLEWLYNGMCFWSTTCAFCAVACVMYLVLVQFHCPLIPKEMSVKML